MRNFIDVFSGAFRAGALSNNVWIAGLSCPKQTSVHHNGCKVCRNACKSFPLVCAIDFENERVIKKRYRRGADYFDEDILGLKVCLNRTEIEEIILARPGGKGLLHSKARFMTLLGSGVRHVVVTDDDTVLYVVKYNEEELEQINLANLPTLKLQKLFDDHLLQTNAIYSLHVNNATLLRVRSMH